MFGRLSREVGPLTDRGRANSIQSCSSERWGYFACPRNSRDRIDHAVDSNGMLLWVLCIPVCAHRARCSSQHGE
jgi:hypothetical protein